MVRGTHGKVANFPHDNDTTIARRPHFPQASVLLMRTLTDGGGPDSGGHISPLHRSTL